MILPHGFRYIGAMKTNLTRLLPVLLVTLTASLLGACQSASVVRIDSASETVVTSLKTDILGGLVGQEAINSYQETRRPVENLGTNQAQADMRAYVIWQLTQRS